LQGSRWRRSFAFSAASWAGSREIEGTVSYSSSERAPTRQPYRMQQAHTDAPGKRPASTVKTEVPSIARRR
jgi:hypothetical protein